jgi:hypothetical protein
MKRIKIILATTFFTCLIFFVPFLCIAQNELSSGSGSIISDPSYTDIGTIEEEETVNVVIQYPSGETKVVELNEEEADALFNLQNALQKQQQSLQTISNVSKMIHDTAMATIRKIG